MCLRFRAETCGVKALKPPSRSTRDAYMRGGEEINAALARLSCARKLATARRSWHDENKTRALSWKILAKLQPMSGMLYR